MMMCKKESTLYCTFDSNFAILVFVYLHNFVSCRFAVKYLVAVDSMGIHKECARMIRKERPCGF